MVIEALCTYGLVLGLSSMGAWTGAWSEFFGRDRFLAINQFKRRRLDAIDFFTFFDEYGLITRPPAVEALRKALEFPANQTINIRQRIETALRAAQGVKQEKTAAAKEEVKKGKKAAFIIKTANFLEKFLEMSDSKRRRRDADSVLNDLTRRAISHERAAQAMHEITVRQKGGWLPKSFLKISQLRVNLEMS
jgi:hypothetical protein